MGISELRRGHIGTATSHRPGGGWCLHFPHPARRLNRYSRIHLPKAIYRQMNLEQPAKRQKKIKTKKSERYEEESEEEGSGSNNNDEYDEKEARAEMKSILKTIDETRGLDYNETFNSVKNLKIRHKLVPELRSALALYFSASNKQLTKWLGCLHKSRRSHQRLMDRGKADENKHRGLITEYDEEEEEVSRGTTPATGNTTENDEDHNKEGEEKPSKSTVGDNHNNSDSDLNKSELIW
ncbi:hypothetical protein RhiirB3_468959 [Rhizophagus irregularis]|nr:hypothetical protein RhiirB3_468959 [Rhizophagus irregularis]